MTTHSSDRTESRQRSLGDALLLVSAPSRALPPPPPPPSGVIAPPPAEEIFDAELIEDDADRELPRYAEDDDCITTPGFAWGERSARLPSLAPTVSDGAFPSKHSQRSRFGALLIAALAIGLTASIAGGVMSRASHPSAFLDRSLSHWSLPAHAVHAARQPKTIEAHGVELSDLPELSVAKEPARAPERAVSGDARLNINSIPMSSVVLDGRPIGSTPIVGLKVAPGGHTVVFINPEQGRRVQSVSVKAGGHAAALVRF